MKQPLHLSGSLRWVQWGSATLGLVLAGFVAWSGHYYQEEVARQAYVENRIKMLATQAGIEDHFGDVREHLGFMEASGEQSGLSAATLDYARRLVKADHGQHVAAVYVTKCDGTEPLRLVATLPSEATDPGKATADDSNLPDAVRQALLGHERQFVEDPAQEFLSSPLVPLPDGEWGIVFSVPVRSDGTFVGMVAGLMPMEQVSSNLERGNFGNMVVLVNDRGDFLGCEDLPEHTAAWFRGRFKQSAVSRFFESQADVFRVGEYAALWTSVCLADGQHWYMAFLYDVAVYEARGRLLGLAGWLTAGLLLLLTGVVMVLCRISRALSVARHMADCANRAKSEFLANMSHEIRTPMTAILGFADVLLESGNLANAPPERIEATRTIKRNGEHLVRLIDDILDLSKIESGRMTTERMAYSPCRLVAEVTSLVRVRADAKGLSLKVEYAGPVPETIQTDPTRLRQILINLLGNAIKFTEVGDVRLIIRFVNDEHHRAMQFDVVDHGLGMTEEQVARLFQPFTQADASTTRKFGGTGLGLAISKRLAELLGGDITVAETRSGAGTRMRVTVATGPLDGVRMIADPLAATVLAPDQTSGPATGDRPRLHGCRILLAEDGPDNQRLIAHMLKKASAEVTVVENGQFATEAALAARDRGLPFDVVLMDMQMPVMDGYKATALLRKEGYRGPIIALTAHAMASDKEKCLAAGCDDYASKPIDCQRLLVTIGRHVRNGRRDEELAGLVADGAAGK
jgi:signal transduction histidine kinase/AmiR/NasT family two-component response regulator